MKPYFANWIVVEGELEVGDMTFWEGDEGYYANEFLAVTDSFITHAIASGWKKYKLFLCTRNIKEGDKVMDEDGDVGIVTDAKDLHNIEVDYENGARGISCMVENCEDKKQEGFQDLFKVIALISPKARWVKVGHEFEENEVRIQKICHDDSTPPYDSYCSYCQRSMECGNNEGDEALILCSNCKTFH